MTWTFLIKVLDNCPNRDQVLEYYRGLETNPTHNQGDSGIDLVIPDSICTTGDTIIFKLGVAIELVNDDGENHSYFLMPRSSIYKYQLIQYNSVGLIDAGYRGELMSVCRAFDYDTIPKLTRLFQIVHPSTTPCFVKVVEELSESQRGSGGFGSTGSCA